MTIFVIAGSRAASVPWEAQDHDRAGPTRTRVQNWKRGGYLHTGACKTQKLEAI